MDVELDMAERVEKMLDERFSTFALTVGGCLSRLNSSIDDKLKSLESSMDGKLTNLESSMDSKLTNLESSMDEKLAPIVETLGAVYEQTGYLTVQMTELRSDMSIMKHRLDSHDLRIARLESK